MSDETEIKDEQLSRLDSLQGDSGPRMSKMAALNAEFQLSGEGGAPAERGPGGEVTAGRKSLSEFIPTATILSMIISAIFTYIPRLKKYNVTDADAECLGNAWAPMAEGYMPDVPEGPFTEALLVTTVIAGSKVAALKKAEKEAAKLAAEKEKAGPGEVVETAAAADQKAVLMPVSSRVKK